MKPFTVVIPARNEAANVGFVVREFVDYPLIERVVVAVDTDTTDYTWDVAHAMGAQCITETHARGKGQTMAVGLQLVVTPRVIFCDADVTGLRAAHIMHLTHPYDGMILGVPDYPSNDELRATGQPRKWKRRLNMAWPMVTGQRSMPTEFAKSIPDLHGYLAETQFNVTAIRTQLPIMECQLIGLHSPFKLTDKRLAEMHRDQLWGIENGWLPNPLEVEK